MSVTVLRIDHSAGAREVPLFVYLARDAEHDVAVVLAEILGRGRRS
jgi:hypothetical protein